MDIFDLEAYVRVVQRGNFSRAAEDLMMTQPALSQRIKQLEAELGYTVLIRRKGIQNIELTDEGQRFLLIAKQMLDLWDSAKSIHTKKDVRKQLRISIINSVLTCAMPSIGKIFTENYPGADIRISSLHSLESYGYIEKNELDMAIVARQSYARGCMVFPIYSDPWVFVCSSDEDYPETVHPMDLDISKQLLLCSREMDEWQEYWFYNTGQKVNINKLTLFNEYVFHDDSWAVLPLTIAKYMECNAHASIRKIRSGPAPRIIYMVQSNQADAEAAYHLRKCIYQCLKSVDGISILFNPEE